MTTTLSAPPSSPTRVRAELVRAGLVRHVVPLAAGVAVIGRLPFLGRVPGPDEADFLMVGRQWDGAGSSLYGSYWVDRPPLLITIFRWAAQLGGAVPLRLVGCVAAALVVIGAADVARRIAGARAARWAAVVAAAWLVSPLLGAAEVNGELLAAPFVLGGMSATLAALSARGRRAMLPAALTGAAAVCALLVKQNMADAAVFAAVAWLLAWSGHQISGRRLGQLVVAAIGGAVAALSLLGVWTMWHGTSWHGVYEATYPFRIHANRVLATYGGDHAAGRFSRLIGAWIIGGAGVLAATSAWFLVSRRLRGPAVWALGATVVFAGGSVVLGGNYWSHYLVEFIAPASVLAGVLVVRTRLAGRTVAAGITLAAAVAWTVWLFTPTSHEAATLGESVGAAAQPQDTIVTIYGHADVDGASGLTSPYPYLWSLPLKTLEPRLTLLEETLNGPTAPTWLVTWYRLSSWGLDSRAVEQTVGAHYHPVATLCGHTVYLHNGVDRPTPSVTQCPAGNPFTTLQEVKP